MVSFVDPASGLEREAKVAKRAWVQLAELDPLVLYETRSWRKIRYVHESRPIEAATTMPQLIFSIGMMLTLPPALIAILVDVREQLFCS